MPFFTPPVVYDNPPFLPATRGRVLMYARHRPNGPRGRSVLKNGSIYTTLDNPTQDQIAAASIAYIGGHIYFVTDAESTALIAAGFTTTPDIFTLYPLPTLYPSETLFPGYDQPVYP